MNALPVGTRVKIHLARPKKGSARRYHGKSGTIEQPLNDGEYGVRVDGTILAFFLPSELVLIDKQQKGNTLL